MGFNRLSSFQVPRRRGSEADEAFRRVPARRDFAVAGLQREVAVYQSSSIDIPSSADPFDLLPNLDVSKSPIDLDAIYKLMDYLPEDLSKCYLLT